MDCLFKVSDIVSEFVNENYFIDFENAPIIIDGNPNSQEDIYDWIITMGSGKTFFVDIIPNFDTLKISILKYKISSSLRIIL